MLGHGDLGQQCLGGPASLEKMGGSLGLHHAGPPLGAGISGPDRDNDLIARGDVIQSFAAVFTDPYHVAAATGANNAVRLDHALDPRQAFGQRPGLAGRTWFALLGVRFAGRDPVLDGRDLRLRLGDGGFQIFQRQFQLGRVQLLGFRPELGAPVILNLALQLRDQRLQLGDEDLLIVTEN